MPRQPRYNLPDVPQHVIQCGNNRQATFFANEDYERYLADLKIACEQHECEVHAYVLMTNHVHLLMTPRKINEISKVMQSLGRRYVRYVNDTYQRTGTLWEGRYKASLVGSERYFLTCSRYIELNPVRADGMAGDVAEYRWSSYRANALGEIDLLLTPHVQYLALGKDSDARQGAYRALFDRAISSRELKEIRESLNQCRVWGSELFKDQIEAALLRRVRPAKAGRPRRTESAP